MIDTGDLAADHAYMARRKATNLADKLFLRRVTIFNAAAGAARDAPFTAEVGRILLDARLTSEEVRNDLRRVFAANIFRTVAGSGLSGGDWGIICALKSSGR